MGMITLTATKLKNIKDHCNNNIPDTTNLHENAQIRKCWRRRPSLLTPHLPWPRNHQPLERLSGRGFQYNCGFRVKGLGLGLQFRAFLLGFMVQALGFRVIL